MQFQFDVAPHNLPEVPTVLPLPDDTADLLRQILEVQKEQLAMQKATAAAHDMGARWRAFLARWQEDYPDLPDICRRAVPVLERSYTTLLSDLGDHLREEEVDNDFALEQVLDRYGMRIGQLGALLSLVSSLADAAPKEESQS